MRKLWAAGFVGISMCCLSAIGVPAAFAEDEWLVSGMPVGEASKAHVEITGTVTMADSSGGTVECSVSGLAFVWEKFGVLEEYGPISCKTLAGSCGAPSFRALHLAWGTELVLEGVNFRNKFLEGHEGAPGWEILCFSIFHDRCASESSEAVLENMPAENPPDVLEKFTQGSIYNCTLGGANSGELKGELLLAALEGLALAVN